MTEVRFEQKGLVGHIVLHSSNYSNKASSNANKEASSSANPQEGNYITADVVNELKAIRDLCGFGSSVRVILLTAQGPDFCLGASSKEDIPGNSVAEEGAAFILASFNQPVIVAMKGQVLDQGLELALAADILLGAEGANFGLTQGINGIAISDGGTQRLARLTGRAKAMEMILLGLTVNSTEALDIGLLNRVFPQDDIEQEAIKMADKMAEAAPQSMRLAKEAVLKGLDLSLSQGLRLETDLYCLIQTTDDRKEGIESFKEKRTPEFTGK
jgi:enoyl-CoA hydratase/carnithine racemase